MRKVDKNTQDIDFVITWVDGNDLEWKREKAARLGNTDMDISVNADDRKERYRDWDNLRYWFRGMEKFCHMGTYSSMAEYKTSEIEYCLP